MVQSWVFLFIIFTYLHSRGGFQGQLLYYQFSCNHYLCYRLRWIFKFCYYDLGSMVSSNLSWSFSQLINISSHLIDTMYQLLKETSWVLQSTWKVSCPACAQLLQILIAGLLYIKRDFESSLNKQKYTQVQNWEVLTCQSPTPSYSSPES